MVIDGWEVVKEIRKYRAVYDTFRWNRHSKSVRTYYMYSKGVYNLCVNVIDSSKLIFIAFGVHNLNQVKATIDRVSSYGFDVRLPTVEESKFIIDNDIFADTNHVWTYELYNNTYRDGLASRKLVLVAEGILEADK